MIINFNKLKKKIFFSKELIKKFNSAFHSENLRNNLK